MRLPVHFSDAILRYDHAIIVFNAAADRIGYTDASRHPGNHARIYRHIAKNGVQLGIGEAAESFLYDQVLSLLGL